MAIFGKGPETKPPTPPGPSTPAPVAPTVHPIHPAPRDGKREVTVIGPQTTFKGEVTGDEDVLVEGCVEGHVHISRELKVGEKGRVKAKVEAQSVIVHGELVGDCQVSGRVEIQATGRLTGDIRAPRIVIAEGAIFRGTSDMSGPRSEGSGG